MQKNVFGSKLTNQNINKN